MRSSLGGNGWRARERSHREELPAGFGVSSEVEPLREVLLAWPPDTISAITDADDWLMRYAPDLDRMRRQCEALVALYEQRGIEVHVFEANDASPNVVFVQDLFLMTPEGAILSRMGSEQRAGEEAHVARVLAKAGVPVLATPRGHTVLEGAGDAIWRDEQTLLVAVGQRTNADGVSMLARMLMEFEIEVHPVFMPGGVSHLRGMLQMVERDRAVVRSALSDGVLVEQLGYHRLETIPMGETREVELGGSLDFVVLEPGLVLMPAGNPSTREGLEMSGLRCLELEFDEYTRAEGGIGSATGVLRRG